METEPMIESFALPGDFPIERALEVFRNRSGCVFLDSSFRGYGLGNCSILACEPYKELVVRGGKAEIVENGQLATPSGDPLEILREEIEKERVPDSSNGPFVGAAIGYIAYEAGSPRAPDPGTATLRFGFYDEAVVWDHQAGSVRCLARTGVGREGGLDRLRRLVEVVRHTRISAESSIGAVSSNFTRSRYLERVERTRQYIAAGEIYQANLSQRFRARFKGDGLALYRRLRAANPAPYAAYLNFEDEEILSSSPERFFFLDKGRIDTRPIKGTRPRGKTAEEEKSFMNELARSEKDRAELLMIVDLERNDLGRICREGTIAVENLFQLETYASVIHQTASISGALRTPFGAVDCIRAMFPGGSITGAPKIRAMEVIDELEGRSRGVYTGSIGYIGFDGRADFNIAIRTMRIADGELSFNVGGGIVWDSVPESEYDETLHKAKSLFDALGVEWNGE